MVTARALHYVLKIGDRGANINFFRNILGMKVNQSTKFDSILIRRRDKIIQTSNNLFRCFII